MTSEPQPDRHLTDPPVAGLLLVGLLAIGAALRFYRLGDWNFEATEMFTLRDSFRPQFGNARPLGYLLNYYLVLPFRSLDEFGLRLMPALAGVAAIPAFYYATRRLIGLRAALFGTLLISLSALQVFYSQFARYWSLVFLFSAVFPFALYLGIRDRRPRLIVLGLVTMVLAVLAHPVSAILVGGPVLWLAATYLRPHYLRQAWTHRSFRWATAAAVVLAIGLIARGAPMLRDWITMHDKNPGMGQFLLGPRLAHGPKQMVLLLAYLEGITLPVALAAAAGLYLLWRERDRSLALFLASLAGFQMAFIALVSIRTPVSTFYLLPAAPVFYVGAGLFLDRVFQVDWRLRPTWLMPGVILATILLAGLPTLASQYRNGRRFDFRDAARWLQPQLGPSDRVVSDQPQVLAHYLDSLPVQKLRHDPEPLEIALSELRQAGDGRLWVVAPAPSHAFRTNLKAGGLGRWINDHCQLGITVGRGRLDFRQQYLQVFRCPPLMPEERPATATR